MHLPKCGDFQLFKSHEITMRRRRVIAAAPHRKSTTHDQIDLKRWPSAHPPSETHHRPLPILRQPISMIPKPEPARNGTTPSRTAQVYCGNFSCTTRTPSRCRVPYRPQRRRQCPHQPYKARSAHTAQSRHTEDDDTIEIATEIARPQDTRYTQRGTRG